MNYTKAIAWVVAIGLILFAGYLFLEVEVNKLGYQAGAAANAGATAGYPPWLKTILGIK